MRVSVYGDRTQPVVAATVTLLHEMGIEEAHSPDDADVALAPLLTRKLSAAELETPTLVFHPSLLPRHRGRDAIKWAFRLGELYTGATWFWANDQYDAGDICEQTVLEFVPGESPREFYERAVAPAAIWLLRFAVEDLRRGHVRRRPQREAAATYEPPLPKRQPSFLEKHWPIQSPIESMGPGGNGEKTTIDFAR